jgi:hypothetical protein
MQQDFLSRLFPNQIEDLLILVTIAATLLVAFLSWQWRCHRRTEIEAMLKQDMLSRGMSAEEIERVLKASMSGWRGGCGAGRTDSSYAAKAR